MNPRFRFAAPLDGAGERLVEASRHFGDALREAGGSVTRGASAGASYARSIGDDVLTNSREAARSVRTAVEERPMEALLIVGLAAFALGWVLRRVQEATKQAPAAAKRATAPSRSRRRASG